MAKLGQILVYPKLSESNLDIERKGSLFGMGHCWKLRCH